MSGDRADEATQDLPEGTQAMPWEVDGTDEQGIASFFEALADDLIGEGQDIADEDDAEEEPEAGLDDRAESEEEEDAGDIEDGDSDPEGDVEEAEEEFEDESEESEEDDPEESPEKQGLRLADYTRKTQELAEERRKAGDERQAFRRDYAERLEALTRAIDEMKGPEPDWDSLRRSNPAEFAAQWAEHQRVQEVQTKLQQEKDRELMQADEELFAREAKLLMSKLPEWAEENTRVREQEAILEYAVEGLGFTEQEVQGVRDHRVFLMLRKAWLADKQASKADEVKEKIRSKRKPKRTLKPGARQSNKSRKQGKSRKDLEAQHKALVDSGGDEKIAASILEQMFDDGTIS
jgi:hypothetical protein